MTHTPNISDLLFAVQQRTQAYYLAQIQQLIRTKELQNIDIALHIALGAGVTIKRIDFLAYRLKEFPTALLEVEGIEFLRLSGNYFTKLIPKDWVSASTIQTLDISALSITLIGEGEDCFFAPFQQLRNLQANDCHWYELPDCIEQLNHLQRLSIRKSALRRIPKLPQLVELNLSGNTDLRALPVDGDSTFKLQHLDISHINLQYLA